MINFRGNGYVALRRLLFLALAEILSHWIFRVGIIWNDFPNISLGGDTDHFPNKLGLVSIICGIDYSIGDTFILDYTAHEIPENR